jgi:GTP-binding protein HflX
VDLAQHEYILPRLRGQWSHLERLEGRIGTRGPGETQLETDRRLIRNRISALKRQIEQVRQQRALHRRQRARQGVPVVSLVGYTNAGKSTLMNALTDADTSTADRLFATLDTLTRKWRFEGGRYALLSDTVGFVHDLPHHLVASFRATLEEAIHADLLLHVVDAASPEADQQYEAARDVLSELGVGDKPTLVLLNKADTVDEASLALLRHKHPDGLLISAKSGAGLDFLADAVEDRMRGEQRLMMLSIPAADGKALDFVERFADVIERCYNGERTELQVNIAPRVLDQLHAIARDVRHDDES